MVEVDGEEQVTARRFGEELFGLVPVEHQRLLHEQRDAGPDDPEGRLEVALVGQAHGDQVGPRPVEHLVQVGVGRGPELGGAHRGLVGSAPDDGDELGVGPGRPHPGVFPAPPVARPHYRHPDPISHRHLLFARPRAQELGRLFGDDVVDERAHQRLAPGEVLELLGGAPHRHRGHPQMVEVGVGVHGSLEPPGGVRHGTAEQTVERRYDLCLEDHQLGQLERVEVGEVGDVLQRIRVDLEGPAGGVGDERHEVVRAGHDPDRVRQLAPDDITEQARSVLDAVAACGDSRERVMRGGTNG